ncbi:MAG: L,D-transpeptidase family protein [Campylobacterota bacterium]|nr:L,D-transpeptidase family protein [Campylobacterota bacterium]
MKITLFVLLFTLSLQAMQVATVYREHGIKAVEKALDIELSKRQYWDTELKNFDTKFGYFENLTSILTCDKDRSKLYKYTINKDGKFHLSHTFNALTGKVNGDKQKEGDKKTPLGVYTLTKKISNPNPFYGPLAYVTSYPNLYDKYRGKNGSGIWIHGQPLEGERDKFTKGCIAIENEDICTLDDNLSLQSSLLIIDQEHIKEAKKKNLSTILSELFAWRYAWLYNEYKKYISFYDPSFIRFDGKDYKTFKRFKKRIFDYKDKKRILFSNIKVVPYPGEESNLYIIIFNEKYYSKRISFDGEKTLVVRLDSDSFKILSER